MGQPVSTNTIAKPIALNPGKAPGGVAPVVDDSFPVTDNMNQGHNNPEGNPAETVTHTDYTNTSPAAQPGVLDTPAHSTTTVVNQIAPAVTVDKWGVSHTVETVDSKNVVNNEVNAENNSTDKGATITTQTSITNASGTTTTTTTNGVTTTVVTPPAYTAPVPPKPAAQAAPKTPATPATVGAIPKPTLQVVGVNKTPANPVPQPVAQAKPATTAAPVAQPAPKPAATTPAPVKQPVAAPVVAYAPLAQTQQAFNQVAQQQTATNQQVSRNSATIANH
ncbi:UNVERIFIED_CONTAM: hypothetical protein RF648_19335, partial [Kocuria sp. CPCC 205274]